MNLQEEFYNQLSQTEKELFRKSEAAYYMGYSRFLEQRLEAAQVDAVVGNLQGKVLMYNGQFVNEYMLHQGIYSTQKPTIHWDEKLDIEKYISDHWFVRETMEVEYPKETYENIRKCEFISVTLKVDQ